MNFNKVIILKLNTSWQPIGFGSVQKTIPDMVAGSAIGLHLSFDLGENGEYNYDSPTESYPVGWEDWIKLPIRDYDEYIQTVNRRIRIPRIVITSHDGMPMIQPKLTSQAVMERDGYTCQYTGKKFSKKNAHKHLNIDHVVPRAAGGRTVWENLVTACRDVNTAKDCKPLEKTGLTLNRKPQKPRPRPVTAQLHQLAPHELEPQWKWLLGGQIQLTD